MKLTPLATAMHASGAIRLEDAPEIAWASAQRAMDRLQALVRTGASPALAAERVHREGSGGYTLEQLTEGAKTCQAVG